MRTAVSWAPTWMYWCWGTMCSLKKNKRTRKPSTSRLTKPLSHWIDDESAGETSACSPLFVVFADTLRTCLTRPRQVESSTAAQCRQLLGGTYRRSRHAKLLFRDVCRRRRQAPYSGRRPPKRSWRREVVDAGVATHCAVVCSTTRG